MKGYTKPVLVIFLVLLIDQVLKTWIKTNMFIGQEFKILAVAGIGYGLYYLIDKKYHRGLILNVALIFAGALGNIIDSVFYGVIYGYAGLFHGRVVDMLYFPLLEGVFPKWLPIWGGEDYIFFRPVFNVADAAISLGVILILVFQKSYFKEEVKDEIGINNEIVED
ncbi:MAG: lipoprotein signal peptidase [Pedobacter sp.]|nr:MAG: lipoprotein signal peptidase [Pedobacter sp.]